MPSSIHCTQKLLAEIPDHLIDPFAAGESAVGYGYPVERLQEYLAAG